MSRLIIAFSIFFGLSIGMPALAEESPMTVDGAETVDVTMAKTFFDQEVPFIDVRKDSDWEAGRVPGAYHIELKNKFRESAMLEVVGKSDEVVIYCNGGSCLRSSEACAKAVEWGFKKVYYFRDGFPAWQAANLPIE